LIRIVRTIRAQEFREAGLHDVFGVGCRTRQPVRESEYRRMMFIEGLK
jgi:hypothetical protein